MPFDIKSSDFFSAVRQYSDTVNFDGEFGFDALDRIIYDGKSVDILFVNPKTRTKLYQLFRYTQNPSDELHEEPHLTEIPAVPFYNKIPVVWDKRVQENEIFAGIRISAESYHPNQT